MLSASGNYSKMSAARVNQNSPDVGCKTKTLTGIIDALEKAFVVHGF